MFNAVQLIMNYKINQRLNLADEIENNKIYR